jgi:2-polyprenyl-3-methyl-5-hydroxy-6-metoxy-1,4-benzoquinol methylase
MDHAHARQKRALLAQILACPSCSGTLREEAEQYVCRSCQRQFPIQGGIPRFLPVLSQDEQQVKRGFNVAYEHYRDSRYLHFTPALIDQWLEDVKLPKDFFKGKLVLDAGCGSGRWTYAMASLGATVVAVDLTDSGVAAAYAATSNMDNVVVLQASLFQLPFHQESFDFVVSWGVMHHTPNTKSAFDRVAPMAKRGGTFYVMVYEKHNPWKFVWTDMIRRVLHRFPEPRRYDLCRHLIIKNRFLYCLLGHHIICAPYPKRGDPLEVSTIQYGLYDAYTPMYNFLHTRVEVASWFEEHKFSQLELTKPIRFNNKKDILRQGECGGSINMRGVRT